MRSLLSIQQLPKCSFVTDKSNFRWTIGDGKKIFFWEDWWTAEGDLARSYPQLYIKSNKQHTTVNLLLEIFQDNPTSEILWNSSLSLLDLENLHIISSTLSTVSLTTNEDILTWYPSGGSFSTKIAYNILSGEDSGPSADMARWGEIWKMKIPPKIAIFLWKLSWGILPTSVFLQYRISSVNSICQWCNLNAETDKHLFWECELAMWTWAYVQRWWCINQGRLDNTGGCFFSLLN